MENTRIRGKGRMKRIPSTHCFKFLTKSLPCDGCKSKIDFQTFQSVCNESEFFSHFLSKVTLFEDLQYICRVHGSTGATGAWAPAKIFQQVPGTCAEKKLGFKDPISSKISVHILAKNWGFKPLLIFNIFLKKGDKTQKFLKWAPVLWKAWSGPWYVWYYYVLKYTQYEL